MKVELNTEYYMDIGKDNKIGKQYYNSEIYKFFLVFMKLKLCIILKFFLNVSDSKPYYAYRFCSYKKHVLLIIAICSQIESTHVYL